MLHLQTPSNPSKKRNTVETRTSLPPQLFRLFLFLAAFSSPFASSSPTQAQTWLRPYKAPHLTRTFASALHLKASQVQQTQAYALEDIRGIRWQSYLIFGTYKRNAKSLQRTACVVVYHSPHKSKKKQLFVATVHDTQGTQLYPIRLLDLHETNQLLEPMGWPPNPWLKRPKHKLRWPTLLLAKQHKNHASTQRTLVLISLKEPQTTRLGEFEIYRHSTAKAFVCNGLIVSSTSLLLKKRKGKISILHQRQRNCLGGVVYKSFSHPLPEYLQLCRSPHTQAYKFVHLHQKTQRCP